MFLTWAWLESILNAELILLIVGSIWSLYLTPLEEICAADWLISVTSDLRFANSACNFYKENNSTKCQVKWRITLTFKHLSSTPDRRPYVKLVDTLKHIYIFLDILLMLPNPIPMTIPPECDTTSIRLSSLSTLWDMFKTSFLPVTAETPRHKSWQYSAIRPAEFTSYVIRRQRRNEAWQSNDRSA